MAFVRRLRPCVPEAASLFYQIVFIEQRKLHYISKKLRYEVVRLDKHEKVSVFEMCAFFLTSINVSTC